LGRWEVVSASVGARGGKSVERSPLARSKKLSVSVVP
jgi:hypothetical protein